MNVEYGHETNHACEHGIFTAEEHCQQCDPWPERVCPGLLSPERCVLDIGHEGSCKSADPPSSAAVSQDDDLSKGTSVCPICGRDFPHSEEAHQVTEPPNSGLCGSRFTFDEVAHACGLKFGHEGRHACQDCSATWAATRPAAAPPETSPGALRALLTAHIFLYERDFPECACGWKPTSTIDQKSDYGQWADHVALAAPSHVESAPGEGVK